MELPPQAVVDIAAFRRNQQPSSPPVQPVEEDSALIPRPALPSARLELTHPVTGVRLTLRAPLPGDMKKLLERNVCPI